MWHERGEKPAERALQRDQPVKHEVAAEREFPQRERDFLQRWPQQRGNQAGGARAVFDLNFIARVIAPVGRGTLSV